MIDAEERALMAETVRGALADAVAAKGDDADGDAVLAEVGWLEMLAEEPDDAVGIVFGALGATNVAATALDDVLAAALGHEPSRALAVVLPAFGGWTAPGRIEGGDVVVAGLATARAAAAERLLVVCGDAGEPNLLEVATSDASVKPVGGVDPYARLHKVELRCSAVDTAPLDAAVWSSTIALAQRGLGHQLAGASRAMLDLARTHALERTQFGRPIARFQAVRHKLAESLVAVEAAEAALDAARNERGAETAALAKAVAGRAARTLGKHAQQVLAGIGFTTEHAFHRVLKRTIALDGLLGSTDAIALDVGRRLLAERRVPPLIEL